MIGLTREGPLRTVILSLSGKGKLHEFVLWLILVSGLIGILLSGYNCFAIGSVLALEATRAAVRIFAGYRSEWMRFLQDEIQEGFRICLPPEALQGSTIPKARVKTIYHERTGNVHGYEVEYTYRCPTGKPTRGKKRMKGKDNEEKQWEIRRVIRSHTKQFITGCDENPSISYYDRDVVRSLAEYVQREQNRRRLGADITDFLHPENDTRGGPHKRHRPNISLIESYIVPIDRPIRNVAGTLREIENGFGPITTGIPYGYWKQQRHELLVWAEFIEPVIAFFGMSFYFVSCWFLSVLKSFSEIDESPDHDPIARSMLFSLLAIVLMIPYCTLEARCVHKSKMSFWKEGGDPLAYTSGSIMGGGTELQRLRNFVRYVLGFGRDVFPRIRNGPKQTNDRPLSKTEEDHPRLCYVRRESLYAPFFVIGTMLLWLGCGITVLIWGYLAVYCMTQWVDHTLPIHRETLEGFQNDARVHNNVTANVTVIADDDSKLTKTKQQNVVTMQYVTPSRPKVLSRVQPGGNPMITVTKKIKSKMLYRKCLADPTNRTTISIHIDPEFPLSGYPSVQLECDISKSWSLFQWQVASIVTLWMYLMYAVSVLEIFVTNDDKDPFASDAIGPEGTFLNIVLLIMGPLLLFPGALVLREIQHDAFLLDALYEPTGEATIQHAI